MWWALHSFALSAGIAFRLFLGQMPQSPIPVSQMDS